MLTPMVPVIRRGVNNNTLFVLLFFHFVRSFWFVRMEVERIAMLSSGITTTTIEPSLRQQDNVVLVLVVEYLYGSSSSV
jgi:hypothetical protein